MPTGDYNECPGISGADRRHREKIRSRGRRRDLGPHPSGLCLRDRLPAGYLGDKYGTLVTAIDLKLDPTTRDVISAKADNSIVRTATLARDAAQTALLEAYDQLAAPLANRPPASLPETLSRTPNNAGESPLGDIIADAQLAATMLAPAAAPSSPSPIRAACAPTLPGRKMAGLPTPTSSPASRSATSW